MYLSSVINLIMDGAKVTWQYPTLLSSICTALTLYLFLPEPSPSFNKRKASNLANLVAMSLLECINYYVLTFL